MIEIKKYIVENLIIPDLKSTNKQEAIAELAERLIENRPDCISKDLTAVGLVEKVMERENVQPTGLGKGMAFPHARIEACSEFACVIGYSKDGIDFDAKDGRKAHLICLMVSCITRPYIILQVMASLAAFAENQKIDYVNGNFSTKDIRSLLVENAAVTRRQIHAGEIMRPVTHTLKLDDSAQHAARKMHLNHIDILPVVDGDFNLKGEISCLDIFRYGIPDFFSQLQTVSFVRHIDPFEKFFKFRKELSVADIYNHKAPTVTKEMTLMEIIFEMSVKNHPILYVVNEGKLVGIIDRFSIIDKILFF